MVISTVNMTCFLILRNHVEIGISESEGEFYLCKYERGLETRLQQTMSGKVATVSLFH